MIKWLKMTSFFIAMVYSISCTNENITDYKPVSKDCYNVGIVVMDGVYNTEVTAPYDIFHHTIFRDSIKPMCVFTVAQHKGSIRSFEGLTFIPDFSFEEDEIPAIDILVIPSAEHHLDSDLENIEMIDWVKKTGKAADYITSHCDGSFILAKAGLLDGIKATTFPSDIETMRRMFPTLDILDDVLFVHDQNVITSAGGAKSFEASLYLCQHLYGKEVADQLAEGLVIDWDLNQTPHLIIQK